MTPCAPLAHARTVQGCYPINTSAGLVYADANGCYPDDNVRFNSVIFFQDIIMYDVEVDLSLLLMMQGAYVASGADCPEAQQCSVACFSE
jgi:hypothetical protein